MGGANKQSGSPTSGAMPEVRTATIPTQQDWRNEISAQRGEQDRANMAKLFLGASQDISKQFGQMGSTQPKPLNQWRDVQKYSQNPSSNNLQFTPLSPVEIYNDERFAVQKGLVSGVGNLASGILSGLSYRGSGSGSNINYKG
jgi:hypothetical protein